jgi:hypothetical protein
MYWTLQNLKDSESKQYILHNGSMFGAATVDGRWMNSVSCTVICLDINNGIDRRKPNLSLFWPLLIHGSVQWRGCGLLSFAMSAGWAIDRATLTDCLMTTPENGFLTDPHYRL